MKSDGDLTVSIVAALGLLSKKRLHSISAFILPHRQVISTHLLSGIHGRIRPIEQRGEIRHIVCQHRQADAERHRNGASFGLDRCFRHRLAQALGHLV